MVTVAVPEVALGIWFIHSAGMMTAWEVTPAATELVKEAEPNFHVNLCYKAVLFMLIATVSWLPASTLVLSNLSDDVA